MSSQFLNVSRTEEITATLGNLFQNLTTFTVKILFPKVTGTSHIPTCACCLLPSKKNLSSPSVSSNHTVMHYNNVSPQPSPREDEPILIHQTILLCHVSLQQFGSLHWNHASQCLPCAGEPQTRHTTSNAVLQV